MLYQVIEIEIDFLYMVSNSFSFSWVLKDFFIKPGYNSDDVSKFPQKKDFLIFLRNGTMHFSAQALKIKELHLGKIYYPSGNEDPPPHPKKKILILQKTQSLKKPLIFQNITCNARANKNKQKSLHWRTFLSLMTFLQSIHHSREILWSKKLFLILYNVMSVF